MKSEIDITNFYKQVLQAKIRKAKKDTDNLTVFLLFCDL